MLVGMFHSYDRPVTDVTIHCEYRFVLVQMGGLMWASAPTKHQLCLPNKYEFKV